MKNLCRFCKSNLDLSFANLGFAPPSNDYLTGKDLSCSESFIPLRVLLCKECWLAQTEDYKAPEDLFKSDYAYFSSASSTWLKHSKKFAHNIIKELNLDEKSFVVELACNDGYLLKNFTNKKIPCLGVEPTNSCAQKAKESGINVIEKFFDEKLSDEIKINFSQADLICANNVLAHVPDISGFVNGIGQLLKEDGTATFEFPHLLSLIKYKQFDTIYHEHYSYLSLIFLCNLLNAKNLRAYKVEKLNTHGGSLRLYVCKNHGKIENDFSVQEILEEEIKFGLNRIDTYKEFQQEIIKIKNNFHSFILEKHLLGKKIVAYGAAAKGNTFLNFCGIKSDLIEYVCDISPSKQNKYLPGSHIPIVDPNKIRETRPDYIIILPWNLKNEISSQLSYVREWGTKFICAIPKLEIF